MSLMPVIPTAEEVDLYGALPDLPEFVAPPKLSDVPKKKGRKKAA